jgi:hypothetical protein
VDENVDARGRETVHRGVRVLKDEVAEKGFCEGTRLGQRRAVGQNDLSNALYGVCQVQEAARRTG